AAIQTEMYSPHFKGAQWEYILADAVATACGCDMFFSKERFEARDPNDSWTLVGTVADLEACQYLLAMLNEQRMRDWMRVKREGASDSFYSFCFSFARAVEANINRRLGAAEIVRRKQAWLWYNEHVTKITTVDLGIRGQGRSDAGRAAGQSASMHRG